MTSYYEAFEVRVETDEPNDEEQLSEGRWNRSNPGSQWSWGSWWSSGQDQQRWENWSWHGDSSWRSSRVRGLWETAEHETEETEVLKGMEVEIMEHRDKNEELDPGTA